jgi:hypothetical protein
VLLAVAGSLGTCCAAAETTLQPVENRPPELKPIGPQIVEEGQPIAFPVIAVDPENDPIEFELSELPPGAAFEEEEQGKGEFTWTPRFDQSGAYEVSFTVRERLSSVTPQEAAERVKISVVEKSLAISGIVIERGSGLPFKDVTLQLISTTPVGEPKKVLEDVVTDEQGFFLFKDVKPERYRVKVLPKRPVQRAAFGTATASPKTTYFAPSHHVVTVTDRDQTGLVFEKTIR